MSDSIEHECGIAMLRLLKPLEDYKEKYGTAFYGIDKMYLLMEKQHNRGQDGAGLASLKFDVPAGTRYISRIRSNESDPIKDIFTKINRCLQEGFQKNPNADVKRQLKEMPYIGNLFLGHVRYGTFGGNRMENVHPFLRQSNWRHKNLIVAGNFNLTNTPELLDKLIELGQHPKEKTDVVTVMEKIGHFLDDEVDRIYQEIKHECKKRDASSVIGKKLNVQNILKNAAEDFDGGYAMAGIIGHGDAFVLRDPNGIRPAFWYKDEEVVVVASERPAIQTVFNAPASEVQEIPAGHAIVIKKNGTTSIEKILETEEKKACSFERIYFSRGSDSEIYKERKRLGINIFPKILKAIDEDIEKTVFSYIPNTAETSFYGLIQASEDFLNERKIKEMFAGRRELAPEKVREILSQRVRVEKIVIKDAKLRTFITEDKSRDDLVAHVYDCTYGVVNEDDNIVVIDDSIVRGTTLEKSIIKILDRLNPKHIIVASSAPQIRYPDCYGIDMSKLGDFIAFRAAIALLEDRGKHDLIKAVYEDCSAQRHKKDIEIKNHVKRIYEPFTDDKISAQISKMLTKNIKAKVTILYQTVAGLREACPNHTGDWYFTGNYPTLGGNRLVNEAFINFHEGKNRRAY